MAYNNPEMFGQIIDKLVISISNHLINQISAGAEVVQIFDSWSSVLNKENFIKWVINPTKEIVNNVKKIYPDIPIIGFPKGAGFFYADYVNEVKIDGISLDANLPYEYINKNLKDKLTIQGNLDPVYLLGNKQILQEQVLNTLNNLSGNKYIFNLGHGIIKDTPVENVEFLIETIRNYR
jgi:uroporphyrinogen decarboxylase